MTPERSVNRWITTSTGAELAEPHAWVVLRVSVRMSAQLVTIDVAPVLVSDSWAAAELAAVSTRASLADATDVCISIVRRPLRGFAPTFRISSGEVVVVYRILETVGKSDIASVCIVPDVATAGVLFSRGEGYHAAPCAMRAGVRN